MFQPSDLLSLKVVYSGSNRLAVTVIELLVVVAIIGALVALLLPAIEMARESSRRSARGNNLRQQAIAVRLHKQAHQIFPTGGWNGWLGDPNAGYGPKQPGAGFTTSYPSSSRTA